MSKDKKVLCIIQARMNSHRLRGKVLKSIQGKSSLQHLLERSSKVKMLKDIVVATTDLKVDDKIVDLCKKNSVNFFRGDETNVLSRFYEISKIYKAKNILRLTADCPLHDPEVIDNIIEYYNSGDFDYVSNSIQRTFPIGLDAEVFNVESLNESYLKASDPLHKEHVTLYINNKFKHLKNGNFKIHNFTAKGDFSFLRWTLDTKEDLERIRFLMKLSGNSYSWLYLVSKLLERKQK